MRGARQSRQEPTPYCSLSAEPYRGATLLGRGPSPTLASVLLGQRARSFEAPTDVARPQRVAIVINPSKKDWQSALDAIAEGVTDAGLPCPTVLETTVADPGTGQARHAVADGHDLVIAAGGDGTVREVALGLLGSRTALGIVPFGTANLFSRNVGLDPRRRAKNIGVAIRGPVAKLDVGLARMRFGARWSGDHLFLVLTGIGNDAATVIATKDHLKSRLGWLAYFESGARHVLRRPIPMTIRFSDSQDNPGVESVVPAWSILAGNCGRLPGGVVLFPAARLDDGLLDTMVVSVNHVGQWGMIGLKGILGFTREVPGMSVGQAREIRITPHQPAPVQLDGDVFGDVAELHVRVQHRALSLKVAV